MEREPLAVQNVKDLQANEKRCLEGILGQQLRDQQQVFIMAFTPDVVTDEATRRRALAGLEQTWERVQKHMLDHGITDEEFDAAVDEAMRHIRPRDS